MRHFSDDEIEALASGAEIGAALESAFRQFGAGRAAVQPRVRIEAGGTKLSTMGAVLPDERVAGAKIYTTVAGRFTFVIVLFASDGRPLATFDGGALTKLRTAAVSAVAAKVLARPDASVLAVFGTGVQARAHVPALAGVLPIREVRVVGRDSAEDFVAEVRQRCGIDARAASAAEALAGADIVVTATRAAQPLFDGARVPDGAFVAAIGSSRPDSRELDDALVGRADPVVVEWKEQARSEAGDLIQAAAGGALDWSRVMELGDLLAGGVPPKRHPGSVALFKSVGIGLEDVALAAMIYRNAGER